MCVHTHTIYLHLMIIENYFSESMENNFILKRGIPFYTCRLVWAVAQNVFLQPWNSSKRLPLLLKTVNLINSVTFTFNQH